MVLFGVVSLFFFSIFGSFLKEYWSYFSFMNRRDSILRYANQHNPSMSICIFFQHFLIGVPISCELLDADDGRDCFREYIARYYGIYEIHWYDPHKNRKMYSQK